MTAGGLTIRPLDPGDPAEIADVLAVHAEGIATGHATFEARGPDWAGWDAKHLARPRLVAVEDGPAIGGRVIGWIAVGAVSTRAVYAGVAEVSVYVGAAARGRGVGRALLDGMIAASEGAGLWSLRASIFPENVASLALHLAAGFRVMGTFERIARMEHGPFAGQWRDTVILERRSPVVGVA
ncbi:MAG: N-acetyltransferase family protein [Azospirillaceae bacterium]